MQDHMERRAVANVKAYLRQHHSEAIAGPPEEELDERILAGIRQAETYGCRQAESIHHFVALLFKISPAFFQRPVFQRILEDPGIPPDSRVQRMFHSVKGPEWEAAIKARSEQQWQDLIRSSQKDPG